MHEAAPTRISVADQTAPPALAFVALLIANVALAFGPWFVRLADTGPVAAGFWRIALAVPLLFVAAFGTGWRPVGIARGLWVTLAIGGVCFAADLASWHLGILKTTLANATLFGNSATLFYPIYGFLIARALPSRMQALALLLAAIGAALLMGKSYELSSANLAGDLLCLLAGILYTGYFVLMARARATMAPLPALALSSLASLAPLLIFAGALGERIWPHHWGPLIGLALASQVLGQGMMIYALGKLSPLVVGIALLTQPIVAGTVGWLVYGETLGTTDLIGALLVAVALVLVRRRAPAPLQLAPVGAQTEKGRMIDPDATLDEIRDALAPAIANNAAFDGWSDTAVDNAAAAQGVDPDVARLAFPGAVDMIRAWFATIDKAMIAAIPEAALQPMKIREKIAAQVEARLDVLAPDRESLRRALAILAMPQNAVQAAKLGWHAADLMWRRAGDTATDYNHYTKRGILAGVYAATITVFLDDESDDHVDTRAFLHRRIDGILHFEKTKAAILRRRERVPSLSRFIGRLRYPAI